LKSSVNIIFLLVALLVCGVLLLTALHRLAVDQEAAWLPSAREIAGNPTNAVAASSPDTASIAITIAARTPDPAGLQSASEAIRHRLKQSGLFDTSADPSLQQGLGDLAAEVVRNLPVLFSAGQLQIDVAPLLTAERIRRSLLENRDGLDGDANASQARHGATDPLGLRHLVLARLTESNAMSVNGAGGQQIWSADRRRLTVLARPIEAIAGTDSVTRFLDHLETAIHQEFGDSITLTHTSAGQTREAEQPLYRVITVAALVMIGVLLALFSRPAIGLLALLPALAGTSVALFLFSWNHAQISGLVVWFGGVIVAVALGHGVWFLLLGGSRPEPESRRPAREMWIVGLPAVLAAIIAFGALTAAESAVIEQLGAIGALSIAVSFGFTLILLPRILPTDQLSEPHARRSVSGFISQALSTGKIGMTIVLLITVTLVGLIRFPVAVKEKTLNSATHPDLYVQLEAPDLARLRASNDRLLDHLDTEAHAGSIAQTATPSLFFPGHGRRSDNYAAWHRFWTDERVKSVSQTIRQEGSDLGIANSAQDSFLKMVAANLPGERAIPARVMPLLGISRDASGDRWHQTIRITPTQRFDPQRFYHRMDAIGVDIVSPAGEPVATGLREKTITTLILTVSGLVLLVVLFLADGGLLAISLMPPVCAALCTLGTLAVMGHFPGDRALLLALPALGLTTGVPLCIARAWQRYQRMDHPDFKATATAVVLTAGLVLTGFGVLMGAAQPPVNTAGWISFLVSSYGLAGTLLILPPLLRRRSEASRRVGSSILDRYGSMTPYPRLAVRFRHRWDPIIDELATIVPKQADMANILDVGCGYGLPACWLAERYPTVCVHAIEPDAERVRVAAMALGERGRVVEGSAPGLPPMDVLVDMAVLIDTSHYLQDWELEKTLERIHERLLPGGRLIIRSLLSEAAQSRWSRFRQRFNRSSQSRKTTYRNGHTLNAILSACGFEVLTCRVSGSQGHRMWHVVRPK
jgi:SAM-dependent methyltransferase